MPEFRQDPFSGRWILLAPERASRPIQAECSTAAVPSGDDPFAEGHEASTTPEVFAIRDAGTLPDGPGWRVRVVTNKYPALVPRPDEPKTSGGLYTSQPGLGVHDVIIECPQFETRMARLSDPEVFEVLCAYRERLLACRRDPRLAAAIVFKNEGALAGASIAHCHSQLMATAFVPPGLAQVVDRTATYYGREGRSLFEAVREWERQHQSRVVLETSRFLAFCPYASRFPYETWILGQFPGSHFGNLNDDLLKELATVLRSILRRLDQALDGPAFNFVLQTAPLQEPELPYFQWSLQILPRLSQWGGYEWGSDCCINTVPPEAAAARLRVAE